MVIMPIMRATRAGKIRKLANVEGWRIRKETEISKRRLGEILVKKGCEEGGVSL